MSNIVSYAKRTGTAPSPALWGDCPFESLQNGIVEGMAHHDDFVNFNTTTDEGYQKILSAGATVTQLDGADLGGWIRLLTAATDNHEAYLADNNDTGLVKIVRDSGNQVWWECLFKVDVITTGSLLLGLVGNAEVALLLMADDQTDAGIFAASTPDFVGFLLAADTAGDGELDAVYNTDGSGVLTVHKNIAKTLVVGTKTRVGMHFDGARSVRWFVDGLQVGATLDPNAANFPDGNPLLSVMAHKNSSAAAHLTDLDWRRVAMAGR